MYGGQRNTPRCELGFGHGKVKHEHKIRKYNIDVSKTENMNAIAFIIV